MPGHNLKDFSGVNLPLGLSVAEVLCRQPYKKDTGQQLFGLFKLSDGSFLAAWKNHSVQTQTLDEMELLYLNHHEKTLLRYGVKDE